MSIKLPDGNITCPSTWHETKCRDLAINCPKFVQVMGTHPQTGDPVSEWGCSDTFLPMLMIENSQQQRQTGAAVESFRNEMVQANAVSQQVLMAAAGINSKLIEGA
jgi:hypothetical protein